MNSPFLTLISGLRRLTSRFRSPPVTQRAKSKIHYIVSPDDVTSNRDNDSARFEYQEEGIPATDLEIDPEIAGISDGEVLEMYDRCLKNELAGTI